METIVEFRAGQMLLADGKLAADSRKGLIRVCQDEAGLAHFCWVERTASGEAVGAPERDIVIIPGECTFNKIPRPGARVFELRFPEEKHRNLFFWAQEADPGSDEDYVAAINFALNQGDGGSEEEDDDQAAGAGAMDTDAPAGTAAATAALATQSRAAGRPAGDPAGGGSGAIGAAALAAALGSVLSGAAAGGLQQQQEHAEMDVGPSLADILRPELVAPLLRDPEIVARLAPHLPEEHRSAEAVAELVATPQFRHQLELLSYALMSGKLDFSQFGLPPGFGIGEFLGRIQEQADKNRAQQGQDQQQQGGAQ